MTLLALGSMGMNFLGNIMGGNDQQEREGFTGSVDPNGMLGQATQAIIQGGRAAQDIANRPVTLPGAYVQQPGGYFGPNMPVPFGLSGVDPALFNPSMFLTLPGANVGGQGGNGSGFNWDINQTALDKAGRVPPPNAQYTGRKAVRRGTSLFNPIGDDTEDAVAALQLLAGM